MDSCENKDENDTVEEDETEEEDIDITDDLLTMQMLGML